MSNIIEELALESKSLEIIKQDIIDKKISSMYLLVCPDKDLLSRIIKVFNAIILSSDINMQDEKIDEVLQNNLLNIRSLTPSKDKITKKDVDLFLDNIHMKSSTDFHKIYNIESINDLSEIYQNKLLKIVEELDTNTVFVTGCTNLVGIRETVISRSKVINVERPNYKKLEEFLKDIAHEKKVAEYAISYSDGWPSDAISFLEDKQNLDMYKDALYIFTEISDSGSVLAKVSKLKTNSKDRNDLAKLLSVMEKILYNLLKDESNINEDFIKIRLSYNIKSISNIILLINKALDQLKSSMGATIVIKSLIYDMLEVRYKCQR